MIQKWEIRKVTDSNYVLRSLLFSAIFFIVFMVVEVDLFSKYAYHNTHVSIIMTLIPTVSFTLLLLYLLIRAGRNCVFELYHDRFVQIYSNTTFEIARRKRVVMFDSIISYKEVLYDLNIKTDAADQKKINLTVQYKKYQYNDPNLLVFIDFADSFIKALEIYVESHPQDYEPHSWLRFREDNWGWVVVGSKNPENIYKL